jgi:excinuclease UvrABC helicase subunit UvrB
MTKKVSKIVLILLGYVFAGVFLFQLTRIDVKVGKLNQKIEDLQYQNEMCEMKRGEEEVIHEESIMVLDAEKENLQTRVKELEDEVAKLKKIRS